MDNCFKDTCSTRRLCNTAQSAILHTVLYNVYLKPLMFRFDQGPVQPSEHIERFVERLLRLLH